MNRLFIALASAFFLFACGGEASSNSVEHDTQSRQQDIYNNSDPVPVFPYSNYRHSLIQLETQLALGNITTWSTWESYGTGTPEGVCKSMGWPIPVSTQLSNPQQLDSQWVNYDGGAHLIDGVVGQMEPTGVYTGQGLGTWILCLDSHGAAHPSYKESVVNAYPYPVELVNGQFVFHPDQADPKTEIKPCKYDPVVKKCL